MQYLQCLSFASRGPLQFLIYINDLPNISIDTNFVLFADDNNIFVKAVNKMLAYDRGVAAGGPGGRAP